MACLPVVVNVNKEDRPRDLGRVGLGGLALHGV